MIIVNRKTISITHVGDSYSAGNGAGSYEKSEPRAYRSSKNWGSEYTKWLKDEGIASTYLNLAYSGYTTNNILEDSYIEKVPTNTDLILMTIGGNDVDFGGIVESCLAPYMARVKECKTKIDNANKKLPDVGKETYKIFESLQSRLKNPNAQIVLVAYPLLSSQTDDLLMNCNHYFHLFCDQSSYYPAAKMVRELGFNATAEQQKIVDLWNSKNQIKVDFVSHTPIAFSSHEPATSSTINKRRWINFFGETDTVYHSQIGTTIGRPTLTTEEYYHPGITGHQKIAELIQKQIGVPKSARRVTPNSNDIDIAFVINTTTASTNLPTYQIRQKIMDSAIEISKKSNSVNIYVTGFSDYPAPNTCENPISSNSDNATQGFVSLEKLLNSENPNWEFGRCLTYDFNLNNSIYNILNANWRPGVKKALIYLDNDWARDDSFLLDNNIFKPKYSAEEIIRKAFEVDPVEIYAIANKGSKDHSSLELITGNTNGKLISTDSDNAGADLSSQKIIEISSEFLAKPFAWLQGPYIIKIGEPITFDARGSYSSYGEIIKYEWDFNGDGVYDKITTSGEITETFQSEHWGYMGVRVTDSSGLASVGSTEFIVSDDGDSTPRAIDNCPDIYNYSQADTDGDGIGDECDPTHGVPDWLDGSQNPESLIDGLIMPKTNIPEYLKMAYGSNDGYIESLIEDGITPSQIVAIVKNLDLKISSETQDKIASVKDREEQLSELDILGENQEEGKEKSEESSKSTSINDKPSQTNTQLVIMISASAIIILAVSGFVIFKKLRKS